MRKTDGCLNCGEVREIAAHGLCFRCYRKDERAEERKFAPVDRHNPGIRREHEKLFRGFISVMTGLAALGVQHPDVLAIRRVLSPYLELIQQFLDVSAGTNESPGTVATPVNTEQPLRLFTVHSGQKSDEVSASGEDQIGCDGDSGERK